MVSQLKGLLGKASRPVIVCGRLMLNDRKLYKVRLENYHVVISSGLDDEEYSEALPTVEQQKRSAEKFDRILVSAVSSFERKFGPVLEGYQSEEARAKVFAYVDSFTGAVVIETGTYRELVKEQLHEQDVRLSSAQEAIVREFTAKQLYDYFEIFYYLLNKRITAQHMPIIVKCHMTKGLFQPLMVESTGIVSPFKYGENQWLYGMFKPYEVFLERREDGVRKMNLSCVAMCDVATLFNVGVIRELDRVNFMFMLCLAFLRRIAPAKSQELFSRYGHYGNKIFETAGESQLLSVMTQLAANPSTALRTV